MTRDSITNTTTEDVPIKPYTSDAFDGGEAISTSVLSPSTLETSSQFNSWARAGVVLAFLIGLSPAAAILVIVLVLFHIKKKRKRNSTIIAANALSMTATTTTTSGKKDSHDLCSVHKEEFYLKPYSYS